MATLGEFIERGMAFFNGQTVAASELEAVKTKLTESEINLELVRGQLKKADAAHVATQDLLSDAQTKIAELIGERDKLQAKVDELNQEAKTVDQSASDKAQALVRAQGIPVSKVPQDDRNAVSADAELASLRKQLPNEKDPLKKAEMAARCRELRGHGDLFKK